MSELDDKNNNLEVHEIQQGDNRVNRDSTPPGREDPGTASRWSDGVQQLRTKVENTASTVAEKARSVKEQATETVKKGAAIGAAATIGVVPSHQMAEIAYSYSVNGAETSTHTFVMKSGESASYPSVEVDGKKVSMDCGPGNTSIGIEPTREHNTEELTSDGPVQDLDDKQQDLRKNIDELKEEIAEKIWRRQREEGEEDLPEA